MYRIDCRNPLVIALPLIFGGEQPSAFGVEKATSKACESGSLIGDTRRGGSCNFEQIQLIPHCNGTHTESIGHITRERISIHDCLKDAFLPAVLVSIEPENATLSSESYSIEATDSDRFITKKALVKVLGKVDKNWLEALIIRTLPNDASKCTRIYDEEIPSFFSNEAMQFIVESGIKHLLVDLPSIDRLFDEGKLSNHRIFWGVKQNSFEIDVAARINSSITELIYVAEKIEDGNYLLNLQIPPFALDAAPSRPVLFRAI